MKKICIKYKQILYPTLFTIIYLAVIMSSFDIFLDNDDTSMSRIISGMMTGKPDAHCEFIKYAFGSIIAFFYKVMPNINWYATFVDVLPGFLCVWVILYRIIENKLITTNLRCVVVSFCVLLLYSVLCFGQLLEPQWTISAGFLGSAAVFLWHTNQWEKDSKLKCVFEMLLITILLMSCYAIRSFAFLMFVVPMAFLTVVRFIQKKKLVYDLIIVFVVVICAFSMELIEEKAYSSDEYAELKIMNSYRAAIADYGGLPDYNENREIYEKYGISYEEQYLVSGLAAYEFFEDLTVEKLYNYVRVLNEVNLNKAEKKNTFFDAILNVKIALWNKQCSVLLVSLLIILILSTVILVTSRDWHSLLTIYLIVLLYFFMCVYLGYKNRFPFRVLFIVFFSLYMTVFAILYNYLCKKTNKVVSKLKCSKVFFTLLLLGFITDALLQGNQTIDSYKVSYESNVNQSYLFDYMKEADSQLFLLGPDFRTFKEKYRFFFDLNKYNYIKMTGWATITPAFDTMIKEDSSEDISQVVIKRNDIYIATDNLYWIEIIPNYYNSIGYNLAYNVKDIVRTSQKVYYIIELYNVLGD